MKSTLSSIREREKEEKEDREGEIQLRRSSELKRKDQQKHKSYLTQHQAASVIQKTWKHHVSKVSSLNAHTCVLICGDSVQAMPVQLNLSCFF